MKTYVGVEVRCQPHSPYALPPRIELPVPIVWGAESAPEPVWREFNPDFSVVQTFA
jgi:hypothetical protein